MASKVINKEIPIDEDEMRRNRQVLMKLEKACILAGTRVDYVLKKTGLERTDILNILAEKEPVSSLTLYMASIELMVPAEELFS